MKARMTECPDCGGPGRQIRRTGYVGDGAEMVGYPIEVMTCASCRRDWVDATLGQLNAVQVELARRMLGDRSLGLARLDAYS
jgi:hypothetical protein